MTYRPNFAAYHVATVVDGQYSPAQDGDLLIRDDNKTYIYRGIEVAHHAAFFAWATGLFCDGDEPSRLEGSARDGWRVEGGFVPPQPIPADDSDEYQAWLDGPYAEALVRWEGEYRPVVVDG